MPPESLSARRTLSARHLLLLGAIGILLATGVTLSWKATTTALLFAGIAAFSGSIAFKAYLVFQGQQQPAWRPAPGELLPDDRLPRYTLLAPLYKEANVARGLVDHLARLDYPQDRLQVLLLCEEDDNETVETLRSMALPANTHVVVVPDGSPRTKPRACDHGLGLATGDLLVIYDAEDRPELDQLRVAASAFAQAEGNVACLQARLDYHNHAAGRLSSFFANEYNHWFDLMLPALAARGLPIPLGGTSNHFRTDLLRELGGWDPYNVTEDADLGIRLWASGFVTLVLDSITWEEACSRLGPWVRQRTRWVKGYMQTLLVHTRSLAWLRSRGRGRVIPAATAFLALIAGTPVVNLLNPLYWTLFTVHLVTRWHLVAELLPAPGLYVAAASFVAGNLMLVGINLLAAWRRGRWHLGRAALFAPAYWLLMSAASWRALWQLLRKPHLWEKTPHGLGVEHG